MINLPELVNLDRESINVPGVTLRQMHNMILLMPECKLKDVYTSMLHVEVLAQLIQNPDTAKAIHIVGEQFKQAIDEAIE